MSAKVQPWDDSNTAPSTLPGNPDNEDTAGKEPAQSQLRQAGDTNKNGGSDKVPDQPLAQHTPSDGSPHTGQQHGLFQFADPEAIKEKVRTAKAKSITYDVKQYYKDPEKSFFAWLASHSRFENTTLGVIIANAIWIAVDTDHNAGLALHDAEWVFVIADVLFFGYFSAELLIRFIAFEQKKNCCKDGWFVFDSSLVFLYLCDPFIITIVFVSMGGGELPFPTAILRLFRLARLSRLVRALRSFPELVIMLKGIRTATASVSYVLGFLILVTYIFAIALVQLSSKPENEEQLSIHETFFDTVPLGIYSLFVYGIFGDNLADFFQAIWDDSKVLGHPVLLIITTIFMVIANIMVLNMLIGILCTVITAVAEEEREQIMVDKVYDEFGSIVKTLDLNSNNMLSWKEFQGILENPQTMKTLENVGVDPEGLIDAAEDYFYEDGEEHEVSFDGFMDMVLELRGGQQAMVKDLIALGKRFSKKMMQVKEIMDTIDVKLEKLMEGA